MAAHDDVGAPALSPEQAQEEFRSLVATQRDRALWHLRSTDAVDILRPEAAAVLQSIAHRGDRKTWQRARGLMRWRSQRLK